MASSSQTPIPPNPNRWKPNVDPASIVIPGLDTTASTIDQIEQIEQLITIKLQNIDENFSKIHNVLANKLLPAVKRYSVGTEPVREAAKFWTSFYEQAAQIRIPTYDDHSTVNEVPSERDELEHSTQENTSHESRDQSTPSQAVYEPSVVNSETSFLPGQGAVSSTPATARLASVHDSFASQALEEPSWSRSLESPLVRLNREISNLNQPEESMMPSTSQTVDSLIDEDESNTAFQQQTSQIPQSNKGKGKETQPLLKNLLRHNLYSASDTSSFESSLKTVSPLKFRGKPKTPMINKELNPYLPSTGSSVNWSGVVDLRDPSVLTPLKHRPGKPGASKKTIPRPEENTDDESFDGLPPGMSPPVLMSPARPPRSSAELGLLKLGQTPSKDFSARVQRDVLRSAQRQTAQRVTHAVLMMLMTGASPARARARARWHKDDDGARRTAARAQTSTTGSQAQPTTRMRSTVGGGMRPAQGGAHLS
ncbi:hypothetical protein NLJ89_g3298 [Agrocybe chaxingu]|uniref:DASH complex subunit ASK1 n=1 Tax=Agrocybe chaxingu TaxID=84603 RepID=A0A9W8K4A4_9AGAR|nr:hypothetical protein NLJ89_g3298 [Agrocybe chaxingu]